MHFSDDGGNMAATLTFIIQLMMASRNAFAPLIDVMKMWDVNYLEKKEKF